ncbi:MAG: ABC transporter permease [Gemmatimonas sp.]
MQRSEWLTSVQQDLRFATRQLLRNPGFALVAVLTLALGIGATSAIFSVVNNVLLRPLPYAHGDRLVQLREKNGANDRFGMFVTFGNYATWVQRTKSFEALAATTGDRSRTLTGNGDPIALRVTRASASYWRAMYIPPVVGRYFTEQEDHPGSPPVVVLSYALWKTNFASDKSIVGRTIILNGVGHTVLGVAAREYALSTQAAASPGIWLPLALTAEQINDHGDHEVSVVGLPREGISAAAAVAELEGVQKTLAREFPNSSFDGGIIARPLRDVVVGDVRSILLLLFGAVALVLLIACANVANLLLARAAVRQKEMAVRSALGGARRRILRQLLVESMVLALVGSAAGLLVAVASLRVLVRNAPASIPRLQDVTLDGTMLLFTISLGLVAGIVFGLVPAYRASRPDLRGTLSEGHRDGAGSLRNGLRASLVVGQVSLALVLLVSAGLLLRSATLLQSVKPGFDPRNALIATIALPESRYSSDTTVTLAFERIVDEVSTIPGVLAAGLISRIPIGAGGADCGVQAEGSTTDKTLGANQRSGTPALIRALGLTLERGRAFTSADRGGAPLVVIINHSLSRELFGAEDPVGKRISSCNGKNSPTVWRTVVGVIGDVRANGLSNDATDEVYYPAAQRLERTMTLVIRGSLPVESLVSDIRRTITSIDPLLPLSGISTMNEVILRSVAVPRFTTLLFALLGALGLALAVIGIYGVIAYFVAQRTREIGVRIALGAKPIDVVRLIVWQGLTLVMAGVSIGLVASWLSAGLIERLLFKVSARDPMIFGGVAMVLLIVSVAASAIPAWKAVRVDPLKAMRA